MSLEYLERLQEALDSGKEYFACQGQNANQWHIATKIEELRVRAQRAANAKRYPVTIYHMVNGETSSTSESFLVARKIMMLGSNAEPVIEWVQVDTKQAAESIRDISFGPSPFFGLSVEETMKPEKHCEPR